MKEFHAAFGLRISNTPKIPPDSKVLELRDNLIAEEFQEYREAVRNNDIVAVADALTDLLYVVYGACVSFGIDADRCFEEVHRSNMSKLGADGLPIRRESDGKVLKGPNFSQPDLVSILAKQIE